MNLCHYILRVPFRGEIHVDIFLKINSITNYIQIYDSDSSLITPRILESLTSLITLTTLFFKTTYKNTFLSDHSDYADLHER